MKLLTLIVLIGVAVHGQDQLQVFLDQADFSMEYTINDTTISFSLSYPGNHWLAIGVNSDNSASMLGNDAAVCLPGSSTLRDVMISARNADGIVNVATNIFTDVNIQQSSGVTVCQWTRPLEAPDDEHVTISGSGTTTVNWARGVDNALAFHADQGAIEVILNTAEVLGVDGDSSTVLAHGSLMLICWNILVPIGIIIARFYKDSDGRWFRLHRLIQTVAVLLNIIAFALIVRYTIDNDKPHFGLPHQITGLIIFILGVLQPLNGFLRPHKDENHVTTARKAWEQVHRWTGRLLVILGFYNINGGSNLLAQKTAFQACWLVIAISLLLFYLLKEYQQWRRSKGGPDYQLKE